MRARLTGEEAESGRCLLAASRVSELVVELRAGPTAVPGKRSAGVGVGLGLLLGQGSVKQRACPWCGGEDRHLNPSSRVKQWQLRSSTFGPEYEAYPNFTRKCWGDPTLLSQEEY